MLLDEEVSLYFFLPALCFLFPGFNLSRGVIQVWL